MKKTLFTLGLGAAAMYLLDPELGEIRRSMLKDKLSGRLPKTTDAVVAKADALVAKVDEVAVKADEAAADAIATAHLPSAGSLDAGSSDVKLSDVVDATDSGDEAAHSKHG